MCYAQPNVTHPLSDSVPYATLDKIQIADYNEDIENLPRIVVHFQRHIKPGNSTSNELTLLLSDTFLSGFFKIGNEHLGVIDLQDNIFYNYDLRHNEFERIAGQGRGPGDIGYSKDYSYRSRDNLLMIASEDYRLSLFSCGDDECQYEETIKTDIMPYSVTLTDKGFALVGMNNVLSKVNETQSEVYNYNNKLIKIYDIKGDIKQRVFNSYVSNNILIRNFYDRSIIRYIQHNNKIAIGLKNLPFIYFYDLNNGKITIFEIQNFQTRDVVENTAKNSMTMSYDRYSILDLMEIVNHRYIYIGVRTYSNIENEESNFKNEVKYYLIDSKNLKTYFLGATKYKEKSLSIRPILNDEDNRVIMNQEGSISIISK